VRPTQHFQRLTLKGMALAKDGHPLRIAIEVVMGSVSSVPSTFCFTKYVKAALVRGTSLRPSPPHKEVRYLDIHADDQLDEELVASWIRQASELPGWVP